jgi:signal transduction histidine kinase
VIDLSMEPHAEGLALVIEAAGGGVADDTRTDDDTRAIEVRLALAHTLIQAHGGRVELESRQGHGMRATMILPRSRLGG